MNTNEKILLIDTSIGTSNIGDQIIMDSINSKINRISKNKTIFRISSHQKPGFNGKRLIKNSSYQFICGTNLLGSSFLKRDQLRIGLLESGLSKNFILLGVGWRQYINKINYLSKFKIKSLINKNNIHSVRDEFTKKNLEKLGFDNVLNTCCPTTWNLTNEHMLSIDFKKKEKVIFTLTDYNKNIDLDKKLIEILSRNYQELYFWEQGLKDLLYLKSLNLKKVKNIKIVQPNLGELDKLLTNEKIDYIGTRLHAGIRALQKKQRSIIVSIDNRAKEISSDIDLKIIERKSIDSLESFIYDENPYILKIPFKEIEKWLNFYS